MKKIAFITDIHLGEQFPIDNNVNSKDNFEKVLTDISKRNIKKIIFGGDIGDASSHNYFFERLKDYSLNLVIGNHDKNNEVAKHFFKSIAANELYYNIENDNYKYIFLDSSSDEISNNQLQWLKLELITTKKVILFIHHPILEIETAVDKLYPLKNREILKSELVEFGKKITLFCGHYHMNSEIEFKNITQFITQSMSFQILKNVKEIEIDNSSFGYRIINLQDDKIETEIINL